MNFTVKEGVCEQVTPHNFGSEGESIETTHRYITADLELKEKVLRSLQPPSKGTFRFQPDDKLLAVLQSLQISPHAGRA